jgi:cell division septum initiation protein DivIVA
MHLLKSIFDHFAPARISHQTGCLERWIDTRRRTVPPSGKQYRHRAVEETAGMERALASYHAAVVMKYGVEEAAIASLDWIEELRMSSAEEPSDWRSVTTAAARRLACRVLVSECVQKSTAE